MHWKVSGLGLVLVAVAAGGMTVEHVSAEQAETQARREYSAWHAAGSLPRGAVAMGYDLVHTLGRDDFTRFCFLLTEEAKGQFARARGTTDCLAGARDLAAEIKPAYKIQYWEYVRIAWSQTSISNDGQSATLDACRLSWQAPWINSRPMPADGKPGPVIGRMVLRHVQGLHGGGFRVADYQPCPAGSPSSTSPSSPPTSAPAPTSGPDVREPGQTDPDAPAPRLLPTYAASFGGTIARRLADAPATVCGLFSPTGAAQFAAAYRAADCPAAAAAMAKRITDPSRYRRPLPARVTKGPRGPVVDACGLHWPTLRRPLPPPPGPQPGRLELERPAGSTGYWITGYRRC